MKTSHATMGLLTLAFATLLREGFPVRLQDRIPTIGLPLTPDRPILPLDLQAAFESAYNLCAFVSNKLYENLPGPELAPEDAAFVREIAARRFV